MKRLYMTVEGQTEQAFVCDVLAPHLASFGVMVSRPRLTGLHKRRRGRIPTGGLLQTFQHALDDMRRWLREDRSREACFSMMVDLYSLPRDFPGYAQGMQLALGSAQAESLEQSLAAEIQDDRFIPHLQVHEFEALVLVEPSRLADLYEVTDADLRRLTAECKSFSTPEEINHGQHSHPKERIRRIIPTYDENIAGPRITGDIGIEGLRRACPHFNLWLTRLEGLDAST